MLGMNTKKKSLLNEDENFTFLGRGVDFKGVVSFEGTVRIDGRLEGEIRTKGTLVVGERAIIKGLISAGTLITGGKIHGNVIATDKVQILKTAILIGDVTAPNFSMEEGAHFQGSCDMGANIRVDQWMEDDKRELEIIPNVHDLVAHRDRIRGVQDS
jgi:cytoskeletal protein CcmA (bactofilin family)